MDTSHAGTLLRRHDDGLRRGLRGHDHGGLRVQHADKGKGTATNDIISYPTIHESIPTRIAVYFSTTRSCDAVI